MARTRTTIVHGTTAYLLVEFTDEDGQASAPVSVEYCVLNPATGDVLKDWDDAEAPAASMTIEIAASINMLDNLPVGILEVQETRRVLIHADFGTDQELQGYKDYVVIGLQGLRPKV